MNVKVSKLQNCEGERLQLVEDIEADEGPGWMDAYKPGSFGCHELLDRTAVAVAMVDGNIRDHPACLQNPDWFALAEKAAAALRDLYQCIGAEHLQDGA